MSARRIPAAAFLCWLTITAHETVAQTRPMVAGRNAGVSAGHPLATAAAVEILQRGGNAFDAGVAALLVGGVVEQDLYSIGGESLTLVYPRGEGKVTSIVGQGWAAEGATIEWYEERGKTLEGKGLDPAVVPGALHGALTVLERWGTMSFEAVSERAIEYARDGYPLRPRTANVIEGNLDFIREWPTNARFWLKPDGSTYAPGDIIKHPDMARTLERMVEAEQNARAGGREAGIVAARDRFYKHDIAREMVTFLQEHGTPFTLDDFSEFYARVEEPTSVNYRGYSVYKQSFNSQGPSLLQALNILETFDLKAMGHNSADYVHVLVEAMKLAFADRDTYYADPEFVNVPGTGLLSKEYARERATEIDMMRASEVLRAGDPLPFDPEVNAWPFWVAGRDAASDGNGAVDEEALEESALKDTTHIAIIDKDGNVFDSTPSGGWIRGAVILGETGIPMSVRGEQFWLDRTRANQLRPRSRPRYTLTPSIVLANGEPFLAIGTPGGDNQEQTIIQTLLTVLEFRESWYPNLHGAIEAPRVQTFHQYGSFTPHPIGLNRLRLEEGVGEDVVRALTERGHETEVVPDLSISGCSTVVMLDPDTGARVAGGDPRRDCYAMAY